MTILQAILYGFLITGGIVLSVFVLAWGITLGEKRFQRVFPNIPQEAFGGGMFFLTASLAASYVVYAMSFPPYN